jgi:hypothetical protein
VLRRSSFVSNYRRLEGIEKVSQLKIYFHTINTNMSNRAFEVNEMIVGMGFAAEFMLFVIAALATPYLWSGFRRVSTSKKYEGRAYMASLFHSIWATGVSMYLMWTVRNDNREMMYRGLYSVDGELLSFAWYVGAGL